MCRQPTQASTPTLTHSYSHNDPDTHSLFHPTQSHTNSDANSNTSTHSHTLTPTLALSHTPALTHSYTRSPRHLHTHPASSPQAPRIPTAQEGGKRKRKRKKRRAKRSTPSCDPCVCLFSPPLLSLFPPPSLPLLLPLPLFLSLPLSLTLPGLLPRCSSSRSRSVLRLSSSQPASRGLQGSCSSSIIMLHRQWVVVAAYTRDCLSKI